MRCKPVSCRLKRVPSEALGLSLKYTWDKFWQIKKIEVHQEVQKFLCPASISSTLKTSQDVKAQTCCILIVLPDLAPRLRFFSLDGVASIYFHYIIESLDDAISSCRVPPYHLRPKQSIHLNNAFNHVIAGTTGIEPRPSAQQASALSISPLPLGPHFKIVICCKTAESSGVA